VEIINPGSRPTDERTVSDGPRKRLDNEDLGTVPEGGGRGEEALLGLIGCLAVENCKEA